ncbi:hypothetical protein BH09ACT6_BH09ACT6_10580 [soil metagenome]
MFVRRAFYYWQVAAVLVLPLWALVGWSVFGGSGWQFLLVLLSCGVLALALAGVGVLNYFRKSVRETRALSWLDTGLLVAWHAAIVSVGFFTPASSILAVAVVVLGLAAFWASIVQLLAETRRRISGVFDSFQYAAQVAEEQAAAGAAGVPSAPLPPIVAQGEYIVIDTARSHQK